MWTKNNELYCQFDHICVILCRSLSNGQRGEVYGVNGDHVAVIVDATEDKIKQDTDNPTKEAVTSSVYLIHGIFSYIQTFGSSLSYILELCFDV